VAVVYMPHAILSDIDSGRVCKVFKGRNKVAALHALGTTFHQYRNFVELDANDVINWQSSNVGILRTHVFYRVEEHSKG